VFQSSLNSSFKIGALWLGEIWWFSLISILPFNNWQSAVLLFILSGDLSLCVFGHCAFFPSPLALFSYG